MQIKDTNKNLPIEERTKNQIENQIFLLDEHSEELKRFLEENDEIDINILRNIQSKMSRIVSLMEMVVIPL